MRNKYRSHIEKAALDVLQSLKLQAIPIDIKTVVKKMKIELVEYKFEGDVSGVLVYRNDKIEIAYNPSDSNVRKRFTIAHELGHYVLKHKREGSIFIDSPNNQFSTKLYRNVESSKGVDLQEIEANAFAAAILMPRPQILEEIEGLHFDLSDGSADSVIDNLARKFNVSSQAMTIRLANIGILEY